MPGASQPELKKFMDKRLFIQVQGGRKVSGVLRGFDIFLNIVLDDSLDESVAGQKSPMGQVIIRGNSVMSMESLEATR